MSILNVEHLTHGFGDRAIFNDVSFRLLKGEHIGLVGANGEGKSTFFNIVTGKLMPDEGKIEWAKNVRVGYLDQHSVLSQGMSIRDVLKSAFSYLFEMEERMNGICDSLGTASPEEMDTLMEELGTIQDTLTMHDFYVIDAKVEEVARALGLLDIGLERDVTDLSGGQRTKVLLGKLLLEKPDILLLDEPTNYLDEEHIEWLKRYLQDYENAFILISHDIPFLNSVINLVYHMENQELNRYVGDYDHFQEVYEVKKAQLEAAYRRQQQEISELKDFVARNKARVSTRNMAMSRQKKLDKMDVIELAAEKPKPEFKFRYGRTPGKMLFETKDLVIGYDEPLSKPLNFQMERGHKIAIVGTNGIGKTTFLNALSQYIPSEERIITVEDSAELQLLDKPNLVRLETRPANGQGAQEISIRDLIRTALRMRPDRIIVGEVRGAEALDMLQALNTGHEGSLSKEHANSAEDMLSRLETMTLMGVDLPLEAIRRQIASGVDILIHLGRMRDKSRKVLEITEICGFEDHEIKTRTLYQWQEGKGLVQIASLLNREKLIRAGVTI